MCSIANLPACSLSLHVTETKTTMSKKLFYVYLSADLIDKHMTCKVILYKYVMLINILQYINMLYFTKDSECDFSKIIQQQKFLSLDF